jgi:hypothetical protein
VKQLVLLTTLFTIGLFSQAQVKLDHKTPEQKLNEEYCTGSFRSTDGTILDVLNNRNASAYRNILEWLDGRVAGFSVYTTRTGSRIPLIRGQQPSVFVDEIPVHFSYLNSLPVADIAMVKVIKTPFMLGSSGGSGAIAVYTLRADDGEEDEEK